MCVCVCVRVCVRVCLYIYIYIYIYIYKICVTFELNIKNYIIIQRGISLKQYYFKSYESLTDCYKQKVKKVYTNRIITR